MKEANWVDRLEIVKAEEKVYNEVVYLGIEMVDN